MAVDLFIFIFSYLLFPDVAIFQIFSVDFDGSEK